MSEILDHWMHEPDAPDLRAHLLNKTALTRGDLMGEEVDVDWVRMSPAARSIDLVGCYAALPHVDNWHPEWFALWVLQHAPGHALHIADRKCRMSQKAIRRPAKAVTEIAPVDVGQVLLFNAHRVHWLPAGAERKMFIAVSFEFDERPSREQVAAAIQACARQLVPLAA